jgi:CO dehydrogenase nickel-insertion accessory protein CooC1
MFPEYYATFLPSEPLAIYRKLKLGTVLAIDADPSTNLNLALGVPVYETVGDIREETPQEVQS